MSLTEALLPPSHLGPCTSGGCHTLEVVVQRAQKWPHILPLRPVIANGFFPWIPIDCPMPPLRMPMPDAGLNPYHTFWGQRSLLLPLLLSWSEQAGEWSFTQMLYTDQTGPGEMNPGWTRLCQFFCTLYPRSGDTGASPCHTDSHHCPPDLANLHSQVAVEEERGNLGEQSF